MKIENTDRLKIIDALIEITNQPHDYFLQDYIVSSAKISRDSGIAIFKELVNEGCLTIVEDCHFKKYDFTKENYNSKNFKEYFYNAMQLGGLRGKLLKEIRKHPGVLTKQLSKITKTKINTVHINLRKLKEDGLITFKKRNYTPAFFIYYWYPAKEYISLLKDLK
ncbi:MAG: winged helix-turn-helix domain-containing protein [Nanoarchaeota archaeon]